MFIFNQVTNQVSGKRISRVSRAENMINIREKLKKMKESRKPTHSQQPDIDKQPDLEVRRVRRRDASKRMDSYGLSAGSVENEYIQDKGARIKIIGSDVEVLYPSLNAVEVAQIVYRLHLHQQNKNVDWDHSRGSCLGGGLSMEHGQVSLERIH